MNHELDAYKYLNVLRGKTNQELIDEVVSRSGKSDDQAYVLTKKELDDLVELARADERNKQRHQDNGERKHPWTLPLSGDRFWLK